jgi:hypothetical protein
MPLSFLGIAAFENKVNLIPFATISNSQSPLPVSNFQNTKFHQLPNSWGFYFPYADTLFFLLRNFCKKSYNQEGATGIMLWEILQRSGFHPTVL